MIKKARWTVKIMSIKTRLILSNLGMIIIPIFSILFIDIAIVNIMLFIFHMAPNENLQLFLNIRFISFLLVLIITIGVLTYFVSKSIIQPIQQLAEAAEKIAHGNLDFSLKIKGKDEISQLTKSFETMRKN
jgi:methyl-accepting chemotaxis protein